MSTADLTTLGPGQFAFATALGVLSNWANYTWSTAVDYLEGIERAYTEIELPAAPEIDIPTDFPTPEFTIDELEPLLLPPVPGAPAIGDHQPPPAPTFTYPAVPVLNAIELPDPPTYSMPTFSEIAPIFTTAAPTPSISADISQYQSTLADAVKAKLYDRIVNGGTGLSPTIEQAIYDRDSERASQELADQIDKYVSEWSKRNLALPDGVLSENLQKMYSDFNIKRLDVSREIAINQANLEQKNISESLNQSISFEDLMVKAWNEYGKLSLDMSKALMDASIEVYKVQLQKYNADVEVYKAKAQVYRDLIQAELAKVQVYTSQIEAVKALVQVDEIRIKAYVAQMEAIKSRVEVYKAEVDAFRGIIEAERVYVEIYRAQIEAYSSQVNAEAKYYEAQIAKYEADFRVQATVAEIAFKNREASIRAHADRCKVLEQRWEALLNYWINKGKLMADTQASAGHTASTVAAGALAGIHAGASVTASGSAQNSLSQSGAL